MFNFSHALFICPLLFLLMFGVALPDSDVSVGGSMWIEHTHIQKCPLRSPSPESVHGNISVLPGSWIYTQSVYFLSGKLSMDGSRQKHRVLWIFLHNYNCCDLFQLNIILMKLLSK